jgi:putative membrane protein
MMWYGNGMSGWGILAMLLYTVVFVGLLVAGIAWLLRASRAEPPTNEDSPTHVLARRYARGELTDDEYRHRLDTLRRA